MLLFLVLFFFVLGTSVAALPLPTGEPGEVEPPLAKRHFGYWTPKPVGEYCFSNVMSFEPHMP